MSASGVSAQAGRPRRLGVLGTVVRDTILPLDGAPRRAWGGIAYSLAALDHVLAPGWTLAPIIKVGADMADRIGSLLATFARIGDGSGVRVAPEANNRVRLTYRTASERSERLTGGVPGWTPREITPHLASLDALYVNFISGRELTLAGARCVRRVMKGPTYADLHSLFLGTRSDGRRTPRYLPSGESWLGCFDTVQMNETEFRLLVREAGNPWKTAAEMAGAARTRRRRLQMLVVTKGSRGAVIARRRRSHERGARPARPGSGALGPLDGQPFVPGGPLARITRSRPEHGAGEGGDPTGCGDAWGAAFFASLLDGAPPSEAARRAHAVARRNLGCTGAEALRDALAAAPAPARRAP